MDADALGKLVIKTFGDRGSAQCTSGFGMLTKDGETTIFGAVQGGTFKVTKIDGHDKINNIVDARENIKTRRKKGEWTGYHCEMLILQAMLNKYELFAATTQGVAGNLKQKGGVVVAANAPCCHHCGSMLDAVGIGYPGKKGERGDTGWWNPLTDAVFANASREFRDSVPGF